MGVDPIVTLEGGTVAITASADMSASGHVLSLIYANFAAAAGTTVTFTGKAVRAGGAIAVSGTPTFDATAGAVRSAAAAITTNADCVADGAVAASGVSAFTATAETFSSGHKTTQVLTELGIEAVSIVTITGRIIDYSPDFIPLDRIMVMESEVRVTQMNEEDRVTIS